MITPEPRFSFAFVLTFLLVLLVATGAPLHAETPDAPEGGALASTGDERFFFELRGGYPLYGDIGAVGYTGILSLGVGIGYRFSPFLALVGSTQGALALSSSPATTAILTETAYLGELMVLAGDTGLYGGIRGGFSFSTLSFTSTTFSGMALGGVWGFRGGYTYRFADSRFALGPEVGWLQFSNQTFTEANTSITTPTHSWMTLQLIAKWVF